MYNKLLGIQQLIFVAYIILCTVMRERLLSRSCNSLYIIWLH